jgi:hypothetical protein
MYLHAFVIFSFLLFSNCKYSVININVEKVETIISCARPVLLQKPLKIQNGDWEFYKIRRGCKKMEVN